MDLSKRHSEQGTLSQEPNLEHPVQRVPVKQVAELQILPKHIIALVAAEPLQPGRMDAAFHPGGQSPCV